MVSARNRRLGRVALTPERARDDPADLELQRLVELLVHSVHPALAVPEQVSDPPDEPLVLLPEHAEQSDPVPVPLLEHALDSSRHLVKAERPPAEEADDLLVPPDLGIAVAIARLGLPQDQSFGLEPH